MSLPYFTLAGYTTHTFSRAYTAPALWPSKPRQKIGRSDGGQFQVATLSSPDEEIPLEFPLLTRAETQAGYDWLNNSAINHAATAFTFVDHEGTSRTVRCLNYTWQPVAADAFNVTILLVVERT